MWILKLSLWDLRDVKPQRTLQHEINQGAKNFRPVSESGYQMYVRILTSYYSERFIYFNETKTPFTEFSGVCVRVCILF